MAISFNDIFDKRNIFPFCDSLDCLKFRITEYIPTNPSKVNSEVLAVEFHCGSIESVKYRILFNEFGEIEILERSKKEEKMYALRKETYNRIASNPRYGRTLNRYSKDGTISRIEFLCDLLSNSSETSYNEDAFSLLKVLDDLIENQFRTCKDWSYPYECNRIGAIDAIVPLWTTPMRIG